VYWQLPVHHVSYPRQTRQPTSSRKYTPFKPDAAKPISSASSSTDPMMLSTTPTQQMVPTSQRQHSHWQRYSEPRNWGNTHSAEHGHKVPKGGGPVKRAAGYGSSWGESWHSYDSGWMQTCDQGWAWTSSTEKSLEEAKQWNHGARATAVEPWNLAPARASHAKQMLTQRPTATKSDAKGPSKGAYAKSQTCTKADAKGPSRQIECCDESSSAEEAVVQLEEAVADFLRDI
jgi:hypothetical protein